MERRSARSQWFASGCLALVALAGAAWAAPGSLDQRALEKPEAVAAWLDEHATTADRRMAQRYFAMGVDSQKKRYWSAAAKSFGESSLFFPTPAALTAYADNSLRGLAEVRARRKDTTRAHTDLAHGLAIYRSALAAEERLKMLDAAALAQLRADEACLSAHVEANNASPPSTATKACRPLTLYSTPRR